MSHKLTMWSGLFARDAESAWIVHGGKLFAPIVLRDQSRRFVTEKKSASHIQGSSMNKINPLSMVYRSWLVFAFAVTQIALTLGTSLVTK
jgi:hypothetical protein